MTADAPGDTFSESERALLRLLTWLAAADGQISAQELEILERQVARLLLVHDQRGDPRQLAAQLVQTTPSSGELAQLVAQLKTDQERQLVACLGQRLLHDFNPGQCTQLKDRPSVDGLDRLMHLLRVEHRGLVHAGALFAHPLHRLRAPAQLQALPESLVCLQSDRQLQLITPPGFCPFRQVWQTAIGPLPANLGELGVMGQQRLHAFYAYLPHGTSPKTGLLLFPGGSVDFRSYALVARDLARQGFVVVVQHVPFGFALFDHDRALRPEGVLRRTFPDVCSWVVGGHSLGGVAAAGYASRRPEDISGLMLWGSYPSPIHSLADQKLPVASLYGSHDGLVSPAHVKKTRHLLPEHAQLLPMNGANHTQFGDYWNGSDDNFLQRGDQPASIARQEQRQQVVEHSRRFLEVVSPSPAR